MAHINVECKAVCADLATIEQQLIALNALHIGTDEQVDTYFVVPNGRLKLREGNIENALIYYERADTATAKLSKVILYTHDKSEALKAILLATHTVQVVVTKTRKIFFINNVKFHLDTLAELGTFIEIEAISDAVHCTKELLQVQCDYYIQLLGIAQHHFIAQSYSNMIMGMQSNS